jgi:hypothetical protein
LEVRSRSVRATTTVAGPVAVRLQRDRALGAGVGDAVARFGRAGKLRTLGKDLVGAGEDLATWSTVLRS